MQIIFRQLGMQPYDAVWQAMRDFTDQRDATTTDEVWLLQHFPVFTQGQAGKAEHILNPRNIPVVQTDRGGQVTYHGPGQIIAYILLDLRRHRLSVRDLVSKIENSIIQILAEYQLTACGRCDAPGVYIDEAKICSLGLRIRRGCSYHGLAFNVAMDLNPFQDINPCGFRNLIITQLADQLIDPQSNSSATTLLATVEQQLIRCLTNSFGYNDHIVTNEIPSHLHRIQCALN